MITGKYEITIQSPAGPMKGILNIIEENGVVTGIQTDDSGDHEILAGKADGNKVNYKVETKTPFGKTKIKAELLIDGDSVTGTASFMLGKLKVEGIRI